jgi:hypothetical protein
MEEFAYCLERSVFERYFSIAIHHLEGIELARDKFPAGRSPFGNMLTEVPAFHH